MWIFNTLYIYAFSLIVLITVIVELSIKRGGLSYFYGRKALHASVITICGIVISRSTELTNLSYVFLVFSLILFLLLHKKVFATQFKASYGIALFPFALFILLQLPFLNKQEILFGVFTLGLSDAAAGYFGFTYAKKQITFLNETKSIVGFFAFYITTIFISIVILQIQISYVLLIVTIIPALTELFSYKGSDNLKVPILSAIWLYIINHTNEIILKQNSIYLIIMLLLAVLIVYKKWLTISGAAAALWIGIIVLFSTDVTHLIPLVFFLIAGSAFSKLTKNKEEKSGRNAIQVFANGIISIFCLLFYYFTKNQIFYIAFFASIAISMCDTISSEVGKYFKQKTYDIIQWDTTPVGLSGGISFAGTAAGLVATLLFAVMVYSCFSITIINAITIAALGFMGMLIDSILGSAIQAKYKNNMGAVTETETAYLLKGYRWCTNDVVNLCSNLITLLIFILFKFFIF